MFVIKQNILNKGVDIYMKKNHKLLKGLVALSSCLSAIGSVGGNAFAVNNSAKSASSETPVATPSVETTKTKNKNTSIKKEKPEVRITRSILGEFEKSINSIRRVRGKSKTISIRVGDRRITLSGEGLTSRADVNRKLATTIVRSLVENYYGVLGSKTLDGASDNDFSDWKCLQPKVEATNIRLSYDKVYGRRRNLPSDFKTLSKKIPSDEVGIFAEEIVSDNKLAEQNYPPQIYEMLLESQEGGRSFDRYDDVGDDLLLN